MCAIFLWSGDKDHYVVPWVKWEKIAVPKSLGGWGLKNVFIFSKALAAKGVWRLLTTNSLWKEVVEQKYISPRSIVDWVRTPTKKISNASIIWKATVISFDLIGNGLAWRVGNGNNVRRGMDLWPGSRGRHLLCI